MLLATLAGIGLAVERDAAQGVKHRSRMYSHGNAAVPRDDAQVLQVVGQISSWAWATRAAVLQAAESLQQAYVAHVSDDEALIARRNQLAEVEAAQAQVIASDWIRGRRRSCLMPSGRRIRELALRWIATGAMRGRLPRIIR